MVCDAYQLEETVFPSAFVGLAQDLTAFFI